MQDFGRRTAMKPNGIGGLTALAASILVAFVGASSAMAEETSLCDVDPGTGSPAPCPAGHLITHVHEEGWVKILTPVLSFTCGAAFLGDALSSLSSPLTIHGAYSYSNCTSNCTITEESVGSEKKILKLGNELADMTYEFLIHAKCGSPAFFDCTFDGFGLKGHGLGPLSGEESGTEDTLTEQTLNKEGGFLCPSKSKLDFALREEKSYIAN
jgi:hypothetical protein